MRTDDALVDREVVATLAGAADIEVVAAGALGLADLALLVGGVEVHAQLAGEAVVQGGAGVTARLTELAD